MASECVEPQQLPLLTDPREGQRRCRMRGCTNWIPAFWATGGHRYHCAECAKLRERRQRVKRFLSGAEDEAKANAARWYQEHAHDPVTCRDCARDLEVRDFYRGRTYRGIKQPCKRCFRAWKAKYYQAHADRYRERQRVYSKTKAGDKECDCGNPRHPGRSECLRCLWLDGWNRGSGMLISLLRDMGGVANSRALDYAIERSPITTDKSLSCQRQRIRWVNELVAQGRARRLDRDEWMDADPYGAAVVVELVDRIPDGWQPPELSQRTGRLANERGSNERADQESVDQGVRAVEQQGQERQRVLVG